MKSSTTRENISQTGENWMDESSLGTKHSSEKSSLIQRKEIGFRKLKTWLAWIQINFYIFKNWKNDL